MSSDRALRELELLQVDALDQLLPLFAPLPVKYLKKRLHNQHR